MVNTKDIMPYNKIWFNCVINRELSLLYTISSKYESLAYNNSYSYDIHIGSFDNGVNFNYLGITNDLCIKSDLLINEHKIDLLEEDEFLGQITRLLKQGKYVMVGVDLYYWIPDSLCWDKNHWYHWSFVQGYDACKKVFYVIDDSKFRYGVFEIPQDRFILAIKESNFDTKAYAYDIAPEVVVDNITAKSVKSNVESIIHNIQDIAAHDCWYMHDEAFLHGFYKDNNYNYLFQIESRQKATLCLLEKIEELQRYDRQAMSSLKRLSNKLIYSWYIMRIKLIRLYSSSQLRKDLIAINKDLQDMLETEIVMWEGLADVLNKDDEILFEF